MLRTLSHFDVGELSERFGPSDPNVLRLGCVVATWPYIPYQVLRKCRRLLDPKMPAYVEAALCDSSLVDGCATDGFSLEASFRRAALSLLRSYRTQTAESSGGAEFLSLHRLMSASYAQLSPLLVIEAELAWDYVLLDDSALRSKVEDRLRDVLFTAVLEKRDGVLDWAAGASFRLPPECIRGEAAWLLKQLCAAQKVEMAPVTAPSAITPAGLMALISERLPLSVIGVYRQSGFIELGPPSPERSVGIVLVETAPMFAFVSERLSTTDYSAPKRVPLNRGQVTRVACGDNEVVLGNLAGQSFTLAKLEEGQCPEAQVALQVIRKAIDARTRRLRLQATVIRPVEAGYVVSLDEIGATAVMFSARCELFEGEKLSVIVDRVYEDKRWISARPVHSSYDYHAHRSLVLRVPAERMPSCVEPGDVFPAKIMNHGKIRGEQRSAHVYVDPQCLLRGLTMDHRPGYLRFGQFVRRHATEWYPPIGARVEILVSGIVDRKWELRLRPCSTALESETPLDPLQRGMLVAATVIVVGTKGVHLEAHYGEPLWLPRSEIIPQPPEGHPIPLRVGDMVQVRILHYSIKFPGRFIVSQRALLMPSTVSQ